MKNIIAKTDGTEAKMPNVRFDCSLCGTSWGADFTDSPNSGYEWCWGDQKLTTIYTVSNCPVCGCQASVTFDRDYFKNAILLKTQDNLVAPVDEQK